MRRCDLLRRHRATHTAGRRGASPQSGFDTSQHLARTGRLGLGNTAMPRALHGTMRPCVQRWRSLKIPTQPRGPGRAKRSSGDDDTPAFRGHSDMGGLVAGSSGGRERQTTISAEDTGRSISVFRRRFPCSGTRRCHRRPSSSRAPNAPPNTSRRCIPGTPLRSWGTSTRTFRRMMEAIDHSVSSTSSPSVGI